MGFDVAEWFWFLGKGLRFRGCQRGDDDGLALVMMVLDGGTVGAAVLVVMELDGDSGSGNGGGLWVLVGESLGCDHDSSVGAIGCGWQVASKRGPSGQQRRGRGATGTTGCWHGRFYRNHGVL
ncbi:hypothetical protein GQ457_15G016710 [Hibiscus cannabinus]